MLPFKLPWDCIAAAEDLLVDIHGTSSGDLLSKHVPVHRASGEGVSAADTELLLASVAASAVTAENELASKVLGSLDPVDYAGGN